MTPRFGSMEAFICYLVYFQCDAEVCTTPLVPHDDFVLSQKFLMIENTKPYFLTGGLTIFFPFPNYALKAEKKSLSSAVRC